MDAIKAPFNEYAGKMIGSDEFAAEIKNAIKAESNTLVAAFQIAFMRPKKMAEEISFAIQHFVIFSNNPEANRLVKYEKNEKMTSSYVDGKAICDLVSKSKLSKTKQKTIFKAVGAAPDHSKN